MRFSVLLPTRNGGHFLADCISSVLEESYDDMELVVSDNANVDETQSVLDSFAGDKRLKVVRLKTAVCVTDNWNRALEASNGDYVLMMGDDDCLLPGYFHRMDNILKKYNNPDCVTYNGYSYVAPHSVSGNTQSYYKDPFFNYAADFTGEGLVSPEKRFSIVRDMFRFRNRIALNMQTTLMSRKAIDNISGGIFRPPFPDHYALNSLLLEAARWVYVPEKLLVLGISPKSFGHFIYSDKQDEGKKYLGIDPQFNGLLPGLELNNCMIVWLLLLKSNYKERLRDVSISRSSYVRRQVYSWYIQCRSGAVSFKDLIGRFKMLSLHDWLYLLFVFVEKQSWRCLGSVFKVSKKYRIQSACKGALPLENISTIKEFAHWINRRPDCVKEKI